MALHKSSVPISPDGQPRFMPRSGPFLSYGTEGLCDSRGRICTSCHWYLLWAAFLTRGQATCKECLRKSGALAVYGTVRRFDPRFCRQEQVTVGDWEALKAAHGFRCLSCGRCEPEIILTVDHIRPVAQGGTNALDNLQPLCLDCNKHKANRCIDLRNKE